MSARDEEGSIIVALAVILVLSGLSLAVLARTVSALASARLAQDSAAAVTAADTGVTDALYVLAHSPGQTTGTGPSFSWTAALGTPTSGTVTSTGTVNGHTHTISVDVRRRRQWRWVLATSGSMVLDGSVTVDGGAALASGGQLVVRNGAGDGTRQALLGPGASCSGCDNPVPTSTDTSLPEPALPSPAPSAPPGGCTAITTLPTGTWWCQGTASFAAPPAAIALGPGQVDLYVTPSGATPAKVDFGGATITPPGGAASFAVHVVGPGVVIVDGSDVTGVIDAPHASLRSGNPCQFSLTGAADLGSFDCVTGATGGASLMYDPTLTGVLSPVWRATSYGDSGP